MKSIIWITLAALLAGGCSTAKRCFKLYPPEVRTDTIITYLDSTVYITIPGDTIRDSIFIEEQPREPGDSVVLSIPAPISLTPPGFVSDTATAFNKYSEARAWVEKENSRYHVQLELITRPQTIAILIDSLKNVHISSVEIHTPPPERWVPWYYKASLPVAIVLFLLLVVLFWLRYRK